MKFLSEKDESINKLRNAFRNKKDMFVSFVGAGTSMPLKILGWEDLLKDYHKFSKCVKSFEEIKNDCSESFPLIAQKIFDESGDLDNYNSFMGDRFNPQNCSFTSIHKKIIDTFKIIITTNYDVAFENILKEMEADLLNVSAEAASEFEFHNVIYPDLDLLALNEVRALVYLHGHKDKGIYVFRESEYLFAYGEQGPNAHFLKGIFKHRSLIFLGFSFRDNFLCETIRKIKQELENERLKMTEIYGDRFKSMDTPQHYVLISLNELIFDYPPDELVEFLNLLPDPTIFFKVNETGNYEFSCKPQDIEDAIYFSEDQKKQLLSNYHISKNNAEKLRYLEELNFIIIPYLKDRHVEIEYILESLKPITIKDSFEL
jgi:SIR2-like domain